MRKAPEDNTVSTISTYLGVKLKLFLIMWNHKLKNKHHISHKHHTLTFLCEEIFSQNGLKHYLLIQWEPNLRSCKWMYNVKINLEGTIARNIATIVIKVYSQQPMVDCVKTFNPLIHQCSVMAILVIAADII